MADLQINNIELLISHPGEVLKCELDERGMSQKELADVIGKATPVINDIIKGKRDINVEIAVLLEAVFEKSIRFAKNKESGDDTTITIFYNSMEFFENIGKCQLFKKET